jgi:hypothetical protein
MSLFFLRGEYEFFLTDIHLYDLMHEGWCLFVLIGGTVVGFCGLDLDQSGKIFGNISCENG